jgi:hypothetical protein
LATLGINGVHGHGSDGNEEIARTRCRPRNFDIGQDLDPTR